MSYRRTTAVLYGELPGGGWFRSGGSQTISVPRARAYLVEQQGIVNIAKKHGCNQNRPMLRTTKKLNSQSIPVPLLAFEIVPAQGRMERLLAFPRPNLCSRLYSDTKKDRPTGRSLCSMNPGVALSSESIVGSCRVRRSSAASCLPKSSLNDFPCSGTAARLVVRAHGGCGPALRIHRPPSDACSQLKQDCVDKQSGAVSSDSACAWREQMFQLKPLVIGQSPAGRSLNEVGILEHGIQLREPAVACQGKLSRLHPGPRERSVQRAARVNR